MNLKKALLNPVLIAFTLGILLNICGVNYGKYLNKETYAWTGYLTGYLESFSVLVTPLSMTIIGMKLGGIKITSLLTSWRAYYVSAVKLIAVPVLVIGILVGLKAISKGSFVNADMVLGSFIAFATPTAGLASTFADQYNGDTDGSVKFIMASTVLSVITIPALYALLLWIL